MSQRNRIRQFLAWLAIVFIPFGVGAFVSAQAANATTGTQTTTIVNDGATIPVAVVGLPSNAKWALDGPSGTGPFTRTTTFVTDTDQSDCSADPTIHVAWAPGDNCYEVTVLDRGPFTTETNAYQPNQGGSQGTPSQAKIANVVSGTFTGTATYFLEAPNTDTPDASNVQTAINDNGTADDLLVSVRNQTSNWWQQLFPSADPNFGTTTGKVDGVLETFNWTYTTADCNEKWTIDSSVYGYGSGAFPSSGFGQSSPTSLDGEITGLVTGNAGCTPPPPADAVTVSFPNGNEQTLEGSAVTDTVVATSSAGHTITSFSATGLPPGLVIVNNGGGTATITGTPTASGAFTVTVTATDSAGTTGNASFTWTVTVGGVIPPPTPGNYGNIVNKFGNGFDVFQQHQSVNTPIVAWPVTQLDPATHFLREAEGGNWRFEYAPNGVGTNLCVSNPGNNLLYLRGCNTGPWQQFTFDSSGRLISVINGGFVNPNGKGGQFSVNSTTTPWGGSTYTWEAESSFPV